MCSAGEHKKKKKKEREYTPAMILQKIQADIMNQIEVSCWTEKCRVSIAVFSSHPEPELKPTRRNDVQRRCGVSRPNGGEGKKYKK